MRTKITKATKVEKAEYLTRKPLYPLYGWITNSDGVRLAIEDLRDHWSKDNPQYEVMAPEGYTFDDGLHSLLGFDLADVRTRVDESGTLFKEETLE